MICRRYLVSGRVQGVFFRDSTRTQALRCGLHGWVRNRRDGRVEAEISGEPDAIDEMEKWLRIGPEHAKVTNIEVTELNTPSLDTEYGAFIVKPTY